MFRLSKSAIIAPMTSQGIDQQYQMLLPRLQRLRDEAVFTLDSALKNTDIKLHSTSSRVKDLPYILRKAERRGLPEPLSSLSDLVGLRVVCLFLSDFSRVSDVSEAAFDVLKVDDRVEGS